MSTEPWAETIRREIDLATELGQVAREIEAWVWGNVVATDVRPHQLPTDLQPHLEKLRDGLQEVKRVASDLFGRMCSGPSSGFIDGRILSSEEFYLLRAMGTEIAMLQALGLSPVDEYQLFRFLWYEDETWRGYINPLEAPRDPHATQVVLRIGRPPEELKEDALRDDQREFFRKYLPQVYVRFKRK